MESSQDVDQSLSLFWGSKACCFPSLPRMREGWDGRGKGEFVHWGAKMRARVCRTTAMGGMAGGEDVVVKGWLLRRYVFFGRDCVND